MLSSWPSRPRCPSPSASTAAASTPTGCARSWKQTSWRSSARGSRWWCVAGAAGAGRPRGRPPRSRPPPACRSHRRRQAAAAVPAPPAAPACVWAEPLPLPSRAAASRSGRSRPPCRIAAPLQIDGEPVEAPHPLDWYPDNLAWQMNFSRSQVGTRWGLPAVPAVHDVHAVHAGLVTDDCSLCGDGQQRGRRERAQPCLLAAATRRDVRPSRAPPPPPAAPFPAAAQAAGAGGAARVHQAGERGACWAPAWQTARAGLAGSGVPTARRPLLSPSFGSGSLPDACPHYLTHHPCLPAPSCPAPACP